jgi:hypothetical protein
MTRTPAASLVLSLVVALALGACTSGGGASLFAKAPPGVDTKVVLLEIVDDNRAALVVGSQPINLLERRTDVYEVRRAGTANQVYVLTDAGTSDESLIDSCGLGCRVRVVKVIRPEGTSGR